MMAGLGLLERQHINILETRGAKSMMMLTFFLHENRCVFGDINCSLT
jgi:hypothetical protein